MALRIFSLLVLQAALAWLGHHWRGWPGAAAGVALAGLVLVGIDTWRGRRFMRWAADPQASPQPVGGGLWGEAAYRLRRALRAEQQKAREAAQRLDEFLAAIQASPNGVVLLDAEGRIEWCNDIAVQHFGFDAERDRLQHVANLVREPAFAAHWAAQPDDREVTLMGRGDAPGRPVRLSVQLHAYGDGHRLMLSRDVTALAQAEAMRRDFVANVSHEIRTPLTVLAGFIETMQSLPLTEAERASHLRLMAAQSARMQALVSDLLTLSRLEGSPAPSLAETVDPTALLAQCEAEARGLSALLHPAQERPQTLVFGPAPDFALAGAAGELRSAAANLINNAVRYTPGGGRIDVRWQRLEGGRASLSVADTGPGIAPEHLPRLTERFYRVDRGRSRETGGTGLGLAIAKHVAQRHGGELRIDSRLGQGSTFSLVLPAQRVRPAPAPT